MRRIVICGLPGCALFCHYLINYRIFGKKTLKSVFRFSVQLLSETFLILKRTERDIKNCVVVIMQSARYSYQILMKLKFSWHFQKIHNYQIS
jgi:hypothetical protein